MMKALLVPVLAAGLALGGTAKDATALTVEETAALLAGLVIVGVIASKQNGGRAEASTARSPLSGPGPGAPGGMRRDPRWACCPPTGLREPPPANPGRVAGAVRGVSGSVARPAPPLPAE